MTNRRYSYESSVKSTISDELINTHVIRPLAGLLVRPLYYTSITPNQVTLASIVAGSLAAFFYLNDTHASNIIAASCIILKDILDSADGQLARAKLKFSRIGRFLDSLGDLFVNLLVFSAIGFALYSSTGEMSVFVLAAIAFCGTTLRVSYHVFYHTSFLHLQNRYTVNRLTEEVRKEDLDQEPLALLLQRTFVLVYGWQDILMQKIDHWCRDESKHSHAAVQEWFSDRIGLRISGLLGLGTEVFLLTVFSVLNELDVYLYVNVFILNLVFVAAIVYRRWSLSPKVTQQNHLVQRGDSP